MPPTKTVTRHATAPSSAIPTFDLDTELTSCFEKYMPDVYHQYTATIVVDTIAGGTPSDPHVAENWLKTKLGVDKDVLIQQAVFDTMVERGIDADAATEIVSKLKHLNGFKRDPLTVAALTATQEAQHSGTSLPIPFGELYIEGRQMKACLKESASVAIDTGVLPKARGYGHNQKKGLQSFLAETLFVEEDRLYLGVTEPTGVLQRFVHTFRGNGIQYEEYVERARLSFTVLTIHDYTLKEWAGIWLTAQQNGVGASRSQGFGRFKVLSWEKMSVKPARVAANRLDRAEVVD